MRLCAALALVLVALVVLTVKAAQRPTRPAPAVVDIDVEAPEIAAPRAPAPLARPAPRAPAPADHRETRGTAHLRGRLLFPTDERAETLEVVAENFSRRVRARIDDDQFELHLPAGRYTLIASMEDLVGAVPDVLAVAGSTQEVDIRLGTGATIRGDVQPEGVEIVAIASGGDENSGIVQADDGAFSIAGLVPGRHYDISFSRLGLRTVTLTGVRAPAEGLRVELEPQVHLSGAIAIPRGMACPIESVELQSNGKTLVDDEGEEVSTDIDDECGFTLPVPSGAAQVTIVATGLGWHVEQPIVIPSRGDPAFVQIEL
jgi:hypothetical protein